MEIKGQEIMSFVPLPKQSIFINLVEDVPECKFAWYCGGFGSGKTFIGSHLAVRLAMSAPNGRGLIARQTLVDLKATTLKTFWEVIDPRLIRKWNKSENLLTLINGHEIYFWGLDDIEKLKSLEIGWFWFDEVDEIAQETFSIAKGRLRHKAQPKRVGYITSNSEGKNWTYKEFVLGKGLARESDKRKYWTVKAPSNENTNLPEDYLDVLNSYTGDLYERYVNASWNVFEGQVFPDFNQAIHTVMPFAIPEDWKRIRGIDHGERNPTACLWGAINKSGDIFIYREYSKNSEGGVYVENHAQNIHKLGEGEEIDYTLIDPSTKSVRGISGRKVDVEYREAFEKLERGFRLKYANNDVNAGLARVHRYLKVDPQRFHPITKRQGAPRIFVFNNCTTLLEEIENYKWAKISQTSEDDPQEKVRKKDDHCVDVLRYIIMSRPDITTSGVKSKLNNQANKKDPDGLVLDNVVKQFPKDFIKV